MPSAVVPKPSASRNLSAIMRTPARLIPATPTAVVADRADRAGDVGAVAVVVGRVARRALA